ncbi:hypothetical protein [Paraburkholderia rhizosphaerae]|uniref:Uncharacterized protein n=1 Tax=Paraburkholderia rhizosphaerae TaxID=480658 RepID=A0A4R8L590_9BURK|nr:hypothetical protein [Paraburkholderia rhizosphaerae]TDY37168.1 hypothetical protein BX592_1428 [Paraburkholderia rhizosphaerae]
MNLTLSPPLRLALIATAAGCTVMLLRPEPVEAPGPASTKLARETREPRVARGDAPPDVHPWRRRALPEPEIPEPAAGATAQNPPLPRQDASTQAGSTPPLPPPMRSAAAQPDIVYLGRLIQDERTQVFFATNGSAVALDTGGVLNGRWRIDAISAADITLRDLQSGETRHIATAESDNASAAIGAAPAQVGQRFLASHAGETTTD